MKKPLHVTSLLVLIGFAFITNAFAQEKPNADAQFRELYPKALSGEPGAMFTLGKIYLEGTSSAGKDMGKGMDYLYRSSNAGNTAATKYMIELYERSGSDRALELCQKLQKTGDKYCDKKMEALVERSIPKNVSPNNCKKVSDIYTSGNQGPVVKSEVTSCVLQGLSTAIPMDQAMSNLRGQATTDPKAFTKLMGFMLKAGTPDWDPLFVEENLSKVGLTFKDKEVRDMFAKNDITFDGCRKMDRLKRENLRQRPSVCRMAARSGDEDAALYVGDAYLGGKDYFPEDAAEASIYVKEAALSKNPAVSTEAFGLLMDIYRKQNKFYEHFATIKQEIKSNSINKRAALASFTYEADYFAKNHMNMSLDDILDLVALSDASEISQDAKSRVGKTIDEVIKDRGRLMRAIEKDSILMYKDRLLSQKEKEEIETLRLAATPMTKQSDSYTSISAPKSGDKDATATDKISTRSSK